MMSQRMPGKRLEACDDLFGPLVNRSRRFRQLGGFGMDVYEREAGLFFSDHSLDAGKDSVLRELLARPDVIVTGHQGFLTDQALTQISASVADSLEDFAAGRPFKNAVVD